MMDDGIVFELFNDLGERIASVTSSGGVLELSPLAQALVDVRADSSVMTRMNASTDDDDPWRVEIILSDYARKIGGELKSALDPDTDDSPPGEQLTY